MIRRIRELLYDQGFTISGARNKLQEIVQAERDKRRNEEDEAIDVIDLDEVVHGDVVIPLIEAEYPVHTGSGGLLHDVRRELLEIRELLRHSA